MKNIKLLYFSYIAIFVFLMNLNSQAQDTQSNVSTPKGSPVVAWVTEEASDANRVYFDNYFASTYPNAEQLSSYDGYSSTRRFNCHGYAWHMSGVGGNHSLSNPRWIGYASGNTDEAIYMTDGSYVQVANEIHPCKISWSSGDHSAISTTSDKYISKWNEWPLMKHDWNDSPFGTINLKYYVSTNINGSSSVLCNNSTRTFTARNISGASYSWSVGSGLSLNSNGNYSTTVTANSSFKGNSWIKVTITSPLGSNNDVKTSKKKTFWIGKPGQPITNPYGYPTVQMSLGEIKSIRVTSATGYPYQYIWDITGSIDRISGSGARITVEATRLGWGNYKVKTRNQCGYSANGGGSVNVVSGGGGPKLYPNPVKSILTIEFDKTNLEKYSETKAKKVYLYNKTMSLLKLKDFYGNSTTLNLSNLKPDVYILKIIVGDEVFEEKIIVSDK